MTPEQQREMGRQIARDIAQGLLHAVSAGAAEFSREMREAREDAEADALLASARRIEAKRAKLEAQIAVAKGLTLVALQRQLAQLEAAEAAEIHRAQGETLMIEHQPESAEVKVKPHKRRRPALNGHTN